MNSIYYCHIINTKIWTSIRIRGDCISRTFKLPLNFDSIGDSQLDKPVKGSILTSEINMTVAVVIHVPEWHAGFKILNHVYFI